MKAIAGLFVVFSFVLAWMARDPKLLDLENEKIKSLRHRIQLPVKSEPPKENERPANQSNSLAQLAPDSFKSDPSVTNAGFGVGYGSGGIAGGGSGLGSNLGQLVNDQTSINRAARVVSRAPLEYPVEARSRGQTGEVIIKILISSNGVVEQALVEASSPPGVFDQAALNAIKQWRFEPAFAKGKAIANWLRQKLKFELN